MMKITSFLLVIIILLSCKSAPDPLVEVEGIENITDKIIYIEKAIQGRLDNETFDELSYMLAKAYDKLGSYDKMAKLVKAIKEKNSGNGKVLSYIALNLAEKGVELDNALLAAETSISWIRTVKSADKPDNISFQAWKQRNKWTMSSYLGTYGVVLVKLDLLARAETTFREAISLDDENVDAVLNLARLCIHNSRFTEAFELAVKVRIMGEEDDAQEIAMESYSSWKKTDEGFRAEYDKQYEQLKEAHKVSMVTNIMSMDAPDFTLNDIAGNTVSLKDFRGKIVFIDFWATWCPPCKEELPVYQAMKNEFEEIVFLAISTDKDTSKVIPFIESNGYNFTVLYDDGAKLEYNVAGIPTVFIVDHEGIIRYKHVGYRPDAEEIWRAQIDELERRQR